MFRIHISVLLLVALSVPANATIKTDGQSLSVTILPDTYRGRQVDQLATVTFQPPELRQFSTKSRIPGDYKPHYDTWEPWPGGTKEAPMASGFSPRKDEDNVTILGPLYNSIQIESIKISNDKQTFQPDVDYKLNPAWNQFANINGRLGKPGDAELSVSYTYATQRIDLIQINRDGTVTVKQGKPVMVTPQLPAPDEGAIGIAGVYIAPWRRNGSYVISPEDIYPIVESTPVAPFNTQALESIRAKLADGKPVSIAFIGDSVTLGAEAGAWWDGMFTETNTTYPTRVILALRKKYPKADITPIHAAKGATTTKAGAGFMQNTVLPKKPDLVLIAYGLNDASGPVGKEPTNPVNSYKEDIRAMIKFATSSGAQVILVSPMQPNPWIKNKIADRITNYCDALRELAREENVGYADVYNAWMKQAQAGIPPFSQLHNWNNHPGSAGHAIYAETILRFFDAPVNNPPGANAKPQANPAADPSSPTVKSSAETPSGFVQQPTDIPGKWELRPTAFPDLPDTLKKARHNPFIYGLYTWTNEFRANQKSIRDVGWKSIRAGGKMDDESMKFYVQDDLEIMHTVTLGKLTKDPGADEKYLKDYATRLDELATRYGPDGTFFKDHPDLPNRPIRYFEILNEPNFQYLIPPDGRPQAELEAAREKIYARILPAAYAVKKKHPKITLVGFAAGGAGAGDMRFIKNVLDQDPQVAKSYDILSTHPYVQPAAPEAWSIRSWGGYSLPDSLKTIRKTLESHQQADMPIWYTEIGWPISQADGGHFATKPEPMVSPLLQAAYVCRTYALSQRLGVERCHIMFITDSDAFNGGFFLRDGGWRPSAKAVQNMIRLMPSPKLIDVLTDGVDGTYVYRFASDDKPDSPETVMAWNVAGPKTIKIPAKTANATVLDLLGNTQEISAVDQQIEVLIGPAPVYIRWK